jgi:hypothetical protein
MINPGEREEHIMPGRIVEDILYILLGANSHKWLRNDDGDGIPNCEDEGYVPPDDGDGIQWKDGR